MICFRNWVFVVLILLLPCRERGTVLINGDIFASFSQLEDLALLEQKLAKDLEEYIAEEEMRFGLIKKFALLVKEAVKFTGEDAPHSPANSYHVLKRFVLGWKNLNDLLDQDKSKELGKHVQQSMLVFPTRTEDLAGAATALLRLQATYNLTTRAVAEGKMPACSAASANLSARDCYEIGVQAFSTGRYAQSRDWLNEASRLLGEDHHDDTVLAREVLERLAEAEYIKGNIGRAVNLTRELLKLEPTLYRAKKALLRFYSTLNKEDLESSEIHVRAKEEEITMAEFTRGAYASLCRGELLENKPSDEPMKCWYHGMKLSRLLLKPIKAEMVLRSPLVYLFHDVVSDREAAILKSLAKSKLSRAKVINARNGELEDADYRISKSAWLTEDHEVITRLNRRFELVTGLEESTAESLQVANYGIGGQYEPHYDFGRPGTPLESSANGNRIATLLIYLNDVESGGYTVFVRKGLYLKPKKGDAVFWYNLKQSGEGDYDTLHAGCPVLCGSKWVANKWYRERGQEFRRRCALDSNQ